jgi:hypothetical protein
MGSVSLSALFKNAKKLYELLDLDKSNSVEAQLAKLRESGALDEIRAPRGLLEKARAYYQEYTPNVVQDALANAATLADLFGLSDPASVYAGPEKAAMGVIGRLAKRAPGAAITTPARTYEEGVALRRGVQRLKDRNVWVRGAEGAAGETNKGRTLLVQFSDDIINPGTKQATDKATQYSDKLYKSVPGYNRPADFWELPDWQTQIANSIPETDTYVVRDLDEAIKFLNSADYDNVAMSVLDVNQGFARKLAESYSGKVSVGGYGNNLKAFESMPNVKTYDSVKDMVEEAGHTFVPGNDYRNFKGTKTVPRLCMSTGCTHGCAFCTIEKSLKETPRDMIMRQADAIAKDLPSPLVYLNDKTFGQAKNHELLPDVFDRIKSQNPDFQGFIIQTSPAQLTKLSPEFIDGAGIKYVELGVESANDNILRAMKKPSSERLLGQVADKLRQTDAKLVPNIMIGLPGETTDTYMKTLKWLGDNEDVISHSNIYNLALYDDSDLAKVMQSTTASDFNENVLQKSWMPDPSVDQAFSNDVYDWSAKQLQRSTPSFSPDRATKPRIFKRLDMVEQDLKRLDALDAFKLQQPETLVTPNERNAVLQDLFKLE